MTQIPASPEAPNAAKPKLRTYAHPPAWITLILVAVLGLLADLGSKSWAFGTLAGQPVRINQQDVLEGRIDSIIPPHEARVAAPKLLEFKLVLNVGAVFGAGPGKRALFVGVTVFAVVFGVFLFGWWTGPQDRMAHVGIGLLLAGGLGNLYDRLVYACVRDFIHPFPGVKLPFGWHYPSGEDQLWPYVSNVADKWLLIGIAILLVHAWRMGGQEHKAPPAAPAPPEA